jgi:cytochrome c oxidase assembly protein subunit 15
LRGARKLKLELQTLEMTRSTYNPWLAKFAAFAALATLCLIGVGGIVTSKGVGMSVPDWPNSYGYNMFLFPVSKWVGGIFEEHVHRLAASYVGLLTVVLAVWIWLKEERPWLRKLGFLALFAVILQGVLGGLRVVLKMDGLGIPHAGLAQAYLCLMVGIAVCLSQWWQRLSLRGTGADLEAVARMKPLLLMTTVLIFAQLLLGAGMRHEHAGLAVPDFPLAYGKIWPDTDAASIDRYNQLRADWRDFNPITATGIYVHMAHRIMALMILVHVTLCFLKARRGPVGKGLRLLTGVWLGLILLQAGLGVVTVLKNKPADIATAHVVVGAASLALGAVMSMMVVRLSRERAAEKSPAFDAALAGSRG